MRTLAIILLLAIPASSSPVTIEEYLEQDPPGVTVSVLSECECDQDDAFPLWPLAFLALTPIFFIDRDDDLLPPLTPIVPESSPTPNVPIPEPQTFGLAMLGLVGLALRRRKKLLLSLAAVVFIAGAASAKPKTGVIKIRTTPADLELAITDESVLSGLLGRTTLAFTEYRYSPGIYHVAIFLPDGSTFKRDMKVEAGCTVTVDLSYTPPVIVERTVTVEVPSPPTKEPCPEIPIQAPELKMFDDCCSCSRDDLKARLDLFAIELNQTQSRGRIFAPSDFALNYLVETRGIDRARLELATYRVGCVQLWVIP